MFNMYHNQYQVENEIKKELKNINNISRTFTEYIKLTRKQAKNNDGIIKDNITLIHNKFSKIENLLRHYKDENNEQDFPNTEFNYEFSDTLYLTEEDLNKLKKENIKFQRMYVWLELFFLKLQEFRLFIIEYFDGNYSLKTIDHFIKDINYLYRQIQVVYKVIEGKSFPDGSPLNKIETKTFKKPSKRLVKHMKFIKNNIEENIMPFKKQRRKYNIHWKNDNEYMSQLYNKIRKLC